MHQPCIRGLTAEADVWLRATETEISTSLWALCPEETLYVLNFLDTATL